MTFVYDALIVIGGAVLLFLIFRLLGGCFIRLLLFLAVAGLAIYIIFYVIRC